MTTTGPTPWGDRPLRRDDLLSAEEAAELLGLRRSTVMDYHRRGELRSVRLGRHVRFLRADVEAFVIAQRDLYA